MAPARGQPAREASGQAVHVALVPTRERGIILEVFRALPEHEMPEQRSPLKVFRHLEEKLKTVGLSPDEHAHYEQLKEIVSSEAAAAPAGPDVAAAAGAPGTSLDPAPSRRPGLAADPRPFDLSTLALDEVEAAFDAAMVPLDEPRPGRDSAAPGPEPAAAGEAAAAPDAGPGALDAGTGSSGLAPGPTRDLQGPARGRGTDAPAYDLGPAAFDAAALPPEPGRAAGDGAVWDAGALPDLAGSEAGLVEAELVEAGPEGAGAEPIEAELVDGAARAAAAPPEAPGADFFASGLPEPDVGGEQPLDAATFAEAEPELDPAGAGREAGPAAPGEDRPAPAEERFERDLAGGPETSEGGDSPTLELAPAPESPGEAGTAEMAPPPAGTDDSISQLDLASPPAEPPPAAGADLEDLEIEEMPPVDVDLGELDEAASPAPGREASSTFVPGEHRVLVQTVEGRVLRGTLTDVDLDASALPLVSSPGAAPEPIAPSRVKAIFFMLLPGGRPPTPEGYKVRVTFRDGKQMAGFSTDEDPGASGFFIVPAESRTGTGRIWIYRRAVQRVSVT